ncbi:hypothetical protein C6558_13795 [Ensifer sp. NM-2]|nr:hypothetical protein C6558_13795 [Ensifer sp. NM-2]
MLGTAFPREVFWRSMVFVWLLIGLMAPAVAARASQPEGAEMQFFVVRSGQTGCEPTCPEWISAEGTIVDETPALFKKLLKSIGTRRLPIVVTSPGGDVDAALAIGRMIRTRKLEAAVGKTRFIGCQPEQQDCRDNDGKGARHIGIAYSGEAYCNSACPLMLAGGTGRVVGEWAFLGVHQITTTYVQIETQYRAKYRVVNGKKKITSKTVVSRRNVGGYKTYEMNKATERKLAAYLAEMGVGRAVIDLMKITPAADIRKIEPVAMLEMKLTTKLGGVELLTSVEACRTVPAAANCRVFVMSDLER